MKKFNVYSFFFFLGMSFSLLGMEMWQSSPQKSLVSSPESSVSPRRNDSNKVVAQKRDSGAKKQISFADESQAGDEKEEMKEEEGTIQFLNNASILPYQIQSIMTDKKLKTCAFGSYVCSNKSSLNLVNEFVGENKRFFIRQGSHTKNFKKDMFDKNVEIKEDSSWHGKTYVGLGYSPSKKITDNEVQEADLVSGSFNLSNSIWNNKTSNFETGLRVIGNAPVAEAVYQMVKSDSPIKENRSIIQNTPKKLSAYSSKDIDLNASWALRLRNLALRTGEGRKAYLRSMTLNDEEIVNAAIEAAQSGAEVHMMLDKAALTSNGEPLVKKMVKNGVTVNIFSSPYGSHKIHHAKNIIIKNGENSKAEVTDFYADFGGNFTSECNNKKNIALCSANNKQVVADAIADFERVSTYCVTVDEAIKLRDEAKVKVAENEKKKVVAENEKKKVVVEKKKKETEEKKSLAKKRKQPSGGRSSKKLPLKKQKK